MGKSLLDPHGEPRGGPAPGRVTESSDAPTRTADPGANDPTRSPDRIDPARPDRSYSRRRRTLRSLRRRRNSKNV